MHQARTPRKPRLRYEQTKTPSYARIHRITRSSSSRSSMSMALPMASPALPWPLLHGRASTTTSTPASQRVHNRSDEESFFSRRRCSLPAGFPFQASGSIGRLFIEKRGAGSLCGSLFSTADDDLVPNNQAMYARVLSCA